MQDVWFIKSPQQLLSYQIEKSKVDILFSSHQNNARSGNIGVFSVLANKRTQAYFKDCVELSGRFPELHDQRIMTNLAALSQYVMRKQKIPDYWKDRPPIPDPPLPVTHEFIDPHVIVASVKPIPTEWSIAVHVLDVKPLQSPHGKKMVAKELGVWHGHQRVPGAGYYDRIGHRARRYLLLDGRVLGGLSLCTAEFYHQGQVVRGTIAALAALAKHTGRILVLPRVIVDYHTYFVWTHLDLKSLEMQGVEFRETSFPNNRKSWWSSSISTASSSSQSSSPARRPDDSEEYPFASVARTAM